MNTILASFEEVAADVRTYEFMGRDQKFVDLVYEKYELDPGDDLSIKKMVSDFIDRDNDMIGLAAVIATVNYFDENVANTIIGEIDLYKDIGKTNNILSLVNLFRNSYKINGFSLNPLIDFLTDNSGSDICDRDKR